MIIIMRTLNSLRDTQTDKTIKKTEASNNSTRPYIHCKIEMNV